MARSLHFSRADLAAGRNELNWRPGTTIRRTIPRTRITRRATCISARNRDDEMCMCYFQVATGSFGELQLLDNDKYAYIGALMGQYRQGMDRRRAAMAAGPVGPRAPASN